MSARVANCLDCDALNWVGTRACNLSMPLHELHALMYATDPSFRQIVDDQREKDRHCSNCNAIVDKEGWLKQYGYSTEGHYECPSCGQLIIEVNHLRLKQSEI